MKLAPSPGPKEDSCNPIELILAASELEVYRHERLAYTEVPVHGTKPPRPFSTRMKNFLSAIACRAMAHH